MAITTEQVNALVWRYLSESGFEHSAFIFSSEANIEPGDSADSQIASGALIFFLQRSLLYTTIEKSLKRGRADPESPLHENIKKIEEQFPDTLPPPVRRLLSRSVEINRETAAILEGHKVAVYACKWSPDGTRLATTSADDKVILWGMKDGVATDHEVLGVNRGGHTQDYGIMTIDWSPSGKYFVTGSLDTSVCLYQANGQIVATLSGHRDKVFAVRFNHSGNFFASVSADCLALVWSVDSTMIMKKFPHAHPVLDLDWKDDMTFATASVDGTVGVISINGVSKALQGHRGDVTAVAWSPGGTYLASASEDHTVRIWKDGGALSVLQGHESGVLCVKWVPKRENVVISAAQNGEVRMWDVLSGACIQTYSRHTSDVISLSVSPDGFYVASGGSNSTIDVTNVLTGEMVVALRGEGNLFELQWDPSGQYLAACFQNGTVAVIPMIQYLS